MCDTQCKVLILKTSIFEIQFGSRSLWILQYDDTIGDFLSSMRDMKFEIMKIDHYVHNCAL